MLRILSRALVAAVALAAVFGQAPARAEQTVIKVWLHEHPPRLPIDKAIIAEFEKANPDIKVQYEVIPPSEYATKLLTAFASGSGPDVFNQVSSLVAQYYTSRILAPIDFAAMGYADEQALTSQYLSGFDGVRFGGKLFGIPTEVSNYACYTNNAMWKEAGLDPARDFPKTWEALPAVAEKLTKRDSNGVPIRRGYDFFFWGGSAIYYWFTINTMMHQLGESVVDDVAYKPTFDTPAGQRVQQYFVDWVNKYKLGGPQYTDSRSAFLGGQLATDCSFGIWGIPQMATAKIDFSVLPAPRWADAKHDNGFDAYAYYMMVNARSSPAVQKAGWKFARAFTDHAAQLFTGAGLFTPRPDVMAQTNDPNSQVFLSELKKAQFSPRVVGFNQITDVLVRGRDRMVQGKEPVATVLPAINEEMGAVMKRERARAEALGK